MSLLSGAYSLTDVSKAARRARLTKTTDTPVLHQNISPVRTELECAVAHVVVAERLRHYFVTRSIVKHKGNAPAEKASGSELKNPNSVREQSRRKCYFILILAVTQKLGALVLAQVNAYCSILRPCKSAILAAPLPHSITHYGPLCLKPCAFASNL